MPNIALMKKFVEAYERTIQKDKIIGLEDYKKGQLNELLNAIKELDFETLTTLSGDPDSLQGPLQKVYGKLPEIVSTHVQDWSKDPLEGGCWARPGQNTTEVDINAILQPECHGRLVFAGEHIAHPGLMSYIHGAYKSGIAANEHIVEAMFKKKTTLKL